MFLHTKRSFNKPEFIGQSRSNDRFRPTETKNSCERGLWIIWPLTPWIPSFSTYRILSALAMLPCSFSKHLFNRHTLFEDKKYKLFQNWPLFEPVVCKGFALGRAPFQNGRQSAGVRLFTQTNSNDPNEPKRTPIRHKASQMHPKQTQKYEIKPKPAWYGTQTTCKPVFFFLSLSVYVCLRRVCLLACPPGYSQTNRKKQTNKTN